MTKTSVLLPMVAVMVGIFETRVYAYLDPGSGSMLVQLLLGGVAGAAVILKLGWQRFRDVFRAKNRRTGSEEPREKHPSNDR